MATKSYRSEIEALIPRLRQCARALNADAHTEAADDLVHDVLSQALRAERSWMGEDVATRLMASLVIGNRARLRSEVFERRSAPAGSGQTGAANANRFPLARREGSEGEAGRELDHLPLNERESLVLVVLGRLDYPQAAQALDIPVSLLVSRVTHARERLGEALWTAASAPLQPVAPRKVRSASHLRLVKS